MARLSGATPGVITTIVIGFSQAACSPCFGALNDCSTPSAVIIMGRVVEPNSATAVPDATISVILTQGGETLRDSASVKVDNTGFFQVPLKTNGGAIVHFDLLVASRGRSYRAEGLTAATSRIRGDALDLGLLTSRPYFNVTGQVVRRCGEGIPFGNVAVVFRRTGGGAVSAGQEASNRHAATTNADGTFKFFAESAIPESLSPVVGTVETTVGGIRLASGATITPSFRFGAPGMTVQVPLAPESTFVGCIYNRATVKPEKEIVVDFVRTGGAPTGVGSYTAVTDSNGAFVLRMNPLAPGGVTGQLTIHAVPPSSPYVLSGVSFIDVGDPAGPPPPRFGVGLHLPYFGRIKRGSVAQSGIIVIARRTGGVATTLDSVRLVTNDAGEFNLYEFKPKGAGTVIVDVTVLAPAPHQSFVIKGVAMSTVDKDSDAQLILDIDLLVTNGVPISTASNGTRGWGHR